MKTPSTYTHQRRFTELMAAFSLFLDEGIDAVKRMYPEYVAFVEDHKGKSLADVKRELQHILAT